MTFDEIMNTRFSTRKFSDKKVSDEIINEILSAGLKAPSAKNGQPIKIYVINSDEAINKMDDCSPCRYGAKTCLLICGNKDEAWNNDREFYPALEVDCAICATTMMYKATSLGVDNIWIRYFDTNKLRENYNIPENIVPVCLMPIGYKEENFEPSPLHFKRKSIDEVVEYR